MKKCCLVLLCLLLSTSAFALPVNLCENLSRLGKVIAEARYAGVTAPELMVTVTEDLTDPAAKKVGIQIVKWAYELPDYSTNEYQQRAIREFANTIYLGCID